MNLFEEYHKIVNQDLIGKIKDNLDDNLGDLNSALDGIYYTLVAGLIRRTNSDMSASMLYNQLKEKFAKNSFQLDNINLLQKKEVFNQVSDDGLKIISQIFPAYKSPLISMISAYAGTSKNNTVKLTGISASILVYFLGNKIKEEKLSKDEVVNIIRQHHERLFEEAPEGLMEKMIPSLGLQELNSHKFSQIAIKKSDQGDSESDETHKEKAVLDNSYDNDSPLISKKVLLSVIAASVLAAIAFYVYSNKNNFSIFSEPKSEAVQIDESLLNPTSDSLAKANVDTLKSNSDTSNVVSQDNLIKNELGSMTTYINTPTELPGKEFELKSISFLPLSFELKPESGPALEELVKVLNANQKTKVKILGLDAAGDLKLENKRAYTIKGILQAKGIKEIRIDAGPGGKGGDAPKIKFIAK